MVEKYWMGHIGPNDDFGQPIKDVFIDGKTTMGPWAIMTPASWRTYGVGRYGTGYGQRYVKTARGHIEGSHGKAKWLKVEG